MRENVPKSEEAFLTGANTKYGNKRDEHKEVTKMWEENGTVGNENVTVVQRGKEDQIMGNKRETGLLFTK